ncbi:hypothetical protein ACXZ66_01280 [Corynebacterium sp. S7]
MLAPPVQMDRERVVISSERSDWAVEFPTLDCYWDPYGMAGQAWWCGDSSDTYVLGSSTMWTDDPEKTLRRQVRANSLDLDGSAGVVVESGDNLMYFFMPNQGSLGSPTMAMAVRGGGSSGGKENEVLFAMVEGTNLTELASLGADLWEGLTGTPMQDELRNHPMFEQWNAPTDPSVPSDPSAPSVPSVPSVPEMNAPRNHEFASAKENHVAAI